MADVIKESFNVRQAHLYFLSRNIVNLVHDFKNHLATVNEFAGLMVDMFKLGHRQRFSWLIRFFKQDKHLSTNQKSLLKELKILQKEAQEASILIQHLGHFSEGLGKSRSTFLANKALEEIYYLLHRYARSSDIGLEIKTFGNGPLIEADLTDFRLAVFYNAKRAINALKSGDKIFLESHTEKENFKISITYPDSPSDVAITEDPDKTFYYDLIKDIGGTIEERYEGKMHIVILIFPLASDKT
jgi:hypothetical protein